MKWFNIYKICSDIAYAYANDRKLTKDEILKIVADNLLGGGFFGKILSGKLGEAISGIINGLTRARTEQKNAELDKEEHIQSKD